MTATERLRVMLDERGVEYFDGTEGTYWGESVPARDGLGSVYRFSAREVIGGLNVHLLRVTPEQAIEATLGGDLKAENAKLRELVRDMAVVICVYDQCATADDCPPALPMFADKMRELGIGVDA